MSRNFEENILNAFYWKKSSYLDSNVTEVRSQGWNWQWVTTGLNNILVPNRHKKLCWLVQPCVRDKRRVSEIDLSQPRHETAFWWRHNRPVTSQLTNPITLPNYPLELVRLFVASSGIALSPMNRWRCHLMMHLYLSLDLNELIHHIQRTNYAWNM